MKKAKIIFILGGAKSGKSKFAIELVKKEKNIVFIATAEQRTMKWRKKLKNIKDKDQNTGLFVKKQLI